MGRWRYVLISAIKDTDDGLVISPNVVTEVISSAYFIGPFPFLETDRSAKKCSVSVKVGCGGADHMTLSKCCIV